jgi:hypothetical protein
VGRGRAEEQRGTFIRGGYYSMKIPAAKNLRVIALNTVLYSIDFVPSSNSSGKSPPISDIHSCIRAHP